MSKSRENCMAVVMVGKRRPLGLMFEMRTLLATFLVMMPPMGEESGRAGPSGGVPNMVKTLVLDYNWGVPG